MIFFVKESCNFSEANTKQIEMKLKDVPALKIAILDLPTKEKDKLLLRLINKDETLVEHLHFQLLEDESDLQDRVKIIYEKIDLQFKKSNHLINQINIIRSHRQLLLTLKTLSGIVNYHVQITKDKVSEFELRKYILQESFTRYSYLFNKYTTGENAEKLFKYQAGRLKLIQSIFDKFHEDLKYDYENEIQQLNDFLKETPLKNSRIE
ncbi:hypothetical protein NZD85_02695 [Empedobacter stercoris]|uniref:hypothetical protein n=1 Tax=Empedobacter stercoris TaxID=1628248 RepID=UPI001CE10B8D|nr:hypothetical protein [Empedobacter stercoris]MCA4781865.1 hypothetical protein [Empedobacter stercoris]UWX67530.1 hypothetical protein NZD85_02695 [Empedobacter stercoris]